MTISPHISMTDGILGREETGHSLILTCNAVDNSRYIKSGFKKHKIRCFYYGHKFLISLFEKESPDLKKYINNLVILHTLLCGTSHRRSMKQNAFIYKSSHNLKSYEPCSG